MNADKIVRALRHTVAHGNDEPQGYVTNLCGGCNLCDAAADLIESLQAENERLAIHGGRYMQLADERYKMFERAIKRADDAETQLSASQRREKAAVDRLKRIDDLCVAFRDAGSYGLADMFARDVMAISGPQEAGEGEQNE